MSLASEDLRWIACPVCHHSLQFAPSGLRCTGCDRYYPVVGSLPILIAESSKESLPKRN